MLLRLFLVFAKKYFHQFSLSGFKVNYPINTEDAFLHILVVMNVCLNFKPLKKGVYFCY